MLLKGKIAIEGLSGTGKFGQHVVTSRIYDPTPVLLDKVCHFLSLGTRRE